ncbi:hypothetical protein V6N13_114258 [Hibiscus sabdariffa]
MSRDRIGFVYCRPNENKWTIVVGKKSEDLDYDGISNVIGFQGKIYGLRHNLDFLEIDFDPISNMVRGVWDGVHLPLASSLGTMDVETYMVESCGELFTIRINFRDYRTVNPSKIFCKKDMGEGGKPWGEHCLLLLRSSSLMSLKRELHLLYWLFFR